MERYLQLLLGVILRVGGERIPPSLLISEDPASSLWRGRRTGKGQEADVTPKCPDGKHGSGKGAERRGGR